MCLIANKTICKIQKPPNLTRIEIFNKISLEIAFMGVAYETQTH